jgi:hypothetical protein
VRQVRLQRLPVEREAGRRVGTATMQAIGERRQRNGR